MTGRLYAANTPHSALHSGRGAVRTGIGHVGREPSGMPDWADVGRANILRTITLIG